MKQSKNEVEEAILKFAKEYNVEDSFNALIESGITLPELSKIIIRKMFIKGFNSYHTNDVLYESYKIIFEYETELSNVGFVEFNK